MDEWRLQQAELGRPERVTAVIGHARADMTVVPDVGYQAGSNAYSCRRYRPAPCKACSGVKALRDVARDSVDVVPAGHEQHASGEWSETIARRCEVMISCKRCEAFGQPCEMSESRLTRDCERRNETIFLFARRSPLEFPNPRRLAGWLSFPPSSSPFFLCVPPLLAVHSS